MGDITSWVIPNPRPKFDDNPLNTEVYRDIHDLLVQPGVRLVMPSEETVNVSGGLSYSGLFDRVRPSGGKADPTHEVSYTTYARVFANDIAEPYMKDEKLRFPVGSMLVREKLMNKTDPKPAMLGAMIKRSRGFSPTTHDWEFVIIDRELSRVRRGEDVRSCVACHANKRDADFVYKSYLK